MAYKFQVEYQKNGSIKITKRNSQAQIYRMPFELLTPGKCEFNVKNPFIVYILFAHNPHGKDYIYVGKSKNGIFGRPKQHKDKFQAELCYILTQEFSGTFFNDGTIQYLEHQVNQKVNETNAFENTTENTNTGTANPSDEDYCNEYLNDAYKMLKVIGLDLDRKYELEESITSEISERNHISKPQLINDPALKVGAFVKKSITRLLDSDYLSDEQFQALCTVNKSQSLTRRSLPLFWKLEEGKNKKDYPKKDMARYWSEEYTYHGQRILIFSQWYADDNVRNGVPNRKGFIEWYKNI
nr:MAG TPA: hypothetical protein [Caudoviricetes sp.]